MTRAEAVHAAREAAQFYRQIGSLAHPAPQSHQPPDAPPAPIPVICFRYAGMEILPNRKFHLTIKAYTWLKATEEK